MLAARSWLQSPLTFNVVTALGTLLAGIGAIWVILAAGPRYRLRYGPLTSQQIDDGKWKVGIYLASRGRRDITRTAFDCNKPVELDIGVRILDLADEPWNSRESTRAVDARADGTCLLVGPGLLPRRQDLRFTVTAEAQPANLMCRASLVDVSIRRQRLTPRSRASLAKVVAFPAAILTGTVTVAVVSSAGVQVQGWIIFISGIIAGIAIEAWAYLRFPFPDD